MIELEDISVSFGDLTVLEEVSLAVEQGEFVGLVGPNGAGKTTLLRVINGVLEPDFGTARVDGAAVTELSARELSQMVATVPQDTHVGFSFTAANIVEMGRHPHRSRLDWTEEDDVVEAAMKRTETWGLREKTVDELSGGERQRVLLARALAQEPDALLLDEPTSSLDINHQIRVLGLVEQLVEEDRAAIAAIHDLDLAARFCDRLVLLHDGSLVANGAPTHVLGTDQLAEAFETATAITPNPITGTPTVAAFEQPPENPETIHVLGSGAGATAAMRTLWQEGWSLSIGPVPEGDLASQLAQQLELPAITAPPFDQPDPETVTAVQDRIEAADLVVLTDDLPAEMKASLSDGADTPRVLADLGGSGTMTARVDGGEDSIVTSESELVRIVRELLAQQVDATGEKKRGA